MTSTVGRLACAVLLVSLAGPAWAQQSELQYKWSICREHRVFDGRMARYEPEFDAPCHAIQEQLMGRRPSANPPNADQRQNDLGALK